MPQLLSVNIGHPEPNPYKKTRATGISKVPQTAPVLVRAPGPKQGGLGSGLVGDHVGDRRHHGGEYQAVYAFAREDLDRWEERLDRQLGNGFFGENLTTRDLDVNGARIGERWQVGPEVVLQVRSPRIPCATFRGQLGERGWLKTFTADARPGAYLEIVRQGRISSGDEIAVLHRPDHAVTVSLVFRALTTEPGLMADLAPAAADLEPELLESMAAAV